MYRFDFGGPIKSKSKVKICNRTNKCYKKIHEYYCYNLYDPTILYGQGKGKGTVSLGQATKAQGGSTGIALFFPEPQH